MQIMTAKTTTMRTLCVHVVLNDVIFRQISFIVPYARHFLPVKFSFQSISTFSDKSRESHINNLEKKKDKAPFIKFQFFIFYKPAFFI